jgi:hypothetical protein
MKGFTGYESTELVAVPTFDRGRYLVVVLRVLLDASLLPFT